MANPGLIHELVDHILELEQAVGGTDTTERFLRIAAKDLDGTCSIVLGSWGSS